MIYARPVCERDPCLPSFAWARPPADPTRLATLRLAERSVCRVRRSGTCFCICYVWRMPVPHSRHVAPTEPLARFVDAQVAEGRYATASEVMRAALWLLMEREDARTTAEAVRREDPTHG